MSAYRNALRTVGALLCYVAAASAAHSQEFSYNGDDGPAYWHELNEAWSACAGGGMMQSPIDIDRVRTDRRLRPLKLRTYPTTIDMFNNGHTIEQRYEDTGSSIHWDGIDYELKQFHFHTLSEHTVGSRHGVMEMHGVFAEPGGTNFVIGQLFYIGYRKNHFIEKLIDAGLPPKSTSPDTVSDELIDFGDGLGDTRSYFTYSGSLTTPPCSEVVTWVVLKKPATITPEQFEAFRSILGNNFRPIQDTHGREVRATGYGGKHSYEDHYGH